MLIPCTKEKTLGKEEREAKANEKTAKAKPRAKEKTPGESKEEHSQDEEKTTSQSLTDIAFLVASTAIRK